MPGNPNTREVLFIKDRNPDREHWTGPLLARDEARERTGITTVLNASAFENFMGSILNRRPYGSTMDEAEAGGTFAALGAGRARLAVVLGDNGADEPSPAQLFQHEVLP